MSLFRQYTLTVKRYGTDGDWIDGYPVENPSPTTFSIYTSVQPATGKDMEVLPEGLRQSDTLKIYPSTKLQTVNQHINQAADVVIINDNDYKVIFVGEWQNSIVPHYKTMIQRVKEKAS
ncbi:MAG: hypothetical protein ACFFDT_04130 [Candidatus Hodarchaeota archaeon]